MATINTILDLISLGYDSVPAVVAMIGCNEINATTRKIMRARYTRGYDYTPLGYCFNPMELARAAWWWYKQPFIEHQLAEFLETEGNIPEEYLVSGKFVETAITLAKRRAQQLRTEKLRCEGLNDVESEARYNEVIRELDEEIGNSTQRVDKRDGMVRFVKEPLEVKEHRRIHKKHREQFSVCILAQVKMKFGVPKRTSANYLAIQRYVGEIIKQKGVRAVDAARVTPYVVAAAFIPSDAEIGAAAWLNTTLAVNRIQGWKHMPTA